MRSIVRGEDDTTKMGKQLSGPASGDPPAQAKADSTVQFEVQPSPLARLPSSHSSGSSRKWSPQVLGASEVQRRLTPNGESVKSTTVTLKKELLLDVLHAEAPL